MGVNVPHLDTIGLIVRGFNSDGTLRSPAGRHQLPQHCGRPAMLSRRDGSLLMPSNLVITTRSRVFEDRSNYGAQRGTTCPSRLLLMFLLLKRLVRWASCRVQLSPLILTLRCMTMAIWFLALSTIRLVLPHSFIHPLAGVIWRETSITPLHSQCTREIGHGGASCLLRWMSTYAGHYPFIGPDYTKRYHVGIIVSDIRSPLRLGSFQQTYCVQRLSRESGTSRFTSQLMLTRCILSGNDLKSGAFGPACLNTHGRERRHIDAIIGTENPCRA